MSSNMKLLIVSGITCLLVTLAQPKVIKDAKKDKVENEKADTQVEEKVVTDEKSNKKATDADKNPEETDDEVNAGAGSGTEKSENRMIDHSGSEVLSDDELLISLTEAIAKLSEVERALRGKQAETNTNEDEGTADMDMDAENPEDVEDGKDVDAKADNDKKTEEAVVTVSKTEEVQNKDTVIADNKETEGKGEKAKEMKGSRVMGKNEYYAEEYEPDYKFKDYRNNLEAERVMNKVDYREYEDYKDDSLKGDRVMNEDDIKYEDTVYIERVKLRPFKGNDRESLEVLPSSERLLEDYKDSFSSGYSKPRTYPEPEPYPNQQVYEKPEPYINQGNYQPPNPYENRRYKRQAGTKPGGDGKMKLNLNLKELDGNPTDLAVGNAAMGLMHQAVRAKGPDNSQINAVAGFGHNIMGLVNEIEKDEKQ